MRLAGALALAALAPAALALTGCETTAEKSAELERAAKLHTIRKAKSNPLEGVLSGHIGRYARASATALVHTDEGTAAVVSVHNLTATALREVPLLLTVSDPSGATLYTNNSPGLSPGLVGIALLPAHATLEWVDDQVQVSGTPAKATAELGEGHPASGAFPPLPVSGQVSERNADGGTVEGTVRNPTGGTEHEVIVYATARRGARISSAGRAVVAEVPPGGATHFQLFLIGDPSGAKLTLSAPPTS